MLLEASPHSSTFYSTQTTPFPVYRKYKQDSPSSQGCRRKRRRRVTRSCMRTQKCAMSIVVHGVTCKDRCRRRILWTLTGAAGADGSKTQREDGRRAEVAKSNPPADQHHRSSLFWALVHGQSGAERSGCYAGKARGFDKDGAFRTGCWEMAARQMPPVARGALPHQPRWKYQLRSWMFAVEGCQHIILSVDTSAFQILR